jgi:surfactin synthase thioesterase subunit
MVLFNRAHTAEQAPLVVVLPHAGASAYQFGALARHLPSDWLVQCLELPGRGRRVREPFVIDFDAAVTDINNRLFGLENRPWVLLGHSLGAHLGMAVLRRRQAAGQSLPLVFFPSGAVAPSAYAINPVASLPSDTFWEKISQFGGVPEAVLADAEYRQYFETILRHDLALLEQAPIYAMPVANRTPVSPLAVPVVVLMGDADAAASRASSWQAETAFPLAVEPFAGGHFYLFEVWPAVAEVIVRHGSARGVTGRVTCPAG